MDEPPHGPEELAALRVLSELQSTLEKARRSLAGKTGEGIARYVAWCAMMVNRAADGYILLRAAHRASASKFLVRPALETTFKTLAVVERPGFLLRIGRTEMRHEGELMRRSEEETEREIAECERHFTQEMPQHPPERGQANIFETAQAAGHEVTYRTYYKLYCQYTHGALRAMVDDLDALTNPFDTPMMCWCVLIALKSLKDHTPATIPELQPLLVKVQEVWPKGDDSPPPQ
jgi:hypothetical protein